ncbi:hypothetical protein IFHNHDMJ_03276 [Synechococcus sp. CBW1107]|nr:hypothetical protein IFHNHDMJ_03276 [Synechococcus sp. CBW1107]
MLAEPMEQQFFWSVGSGYNNGLEIKLKVVV